MKDYFLKLFAYDKYTNNLLTTEMEAMGNPPDACRLMSHILAAQQVWLERCKGEPNPNPAIWPDWQPDSFTQRNNDINREWSEFLESCPENNFSNVVAYCNSKGDKFSDILQDIITHVINHGTHHRAQVGQLLKAHGLKKLPLTDYIFYIRSRN